MKNTQVRGGYAVFVGVAEGTLSVGDEVNEQFDEVRRSPRLTTTNVLFAATPLADHEEPHWHSCA